MPGGDGDRDTPPTSRAASSQLRRTDYSTAGRERRPRPLPRHLGGRRQRPERRPAGGDLPAHRAQADVGEELGTLRNTDLLGGVCNDVLTLKKVTAKELVVTSVGRKGNHAGCNPTPHPVRITPAGDDLVSARERRGGETRARLSQVGDGCGDRSARGRRRAARCRGGFAAEGRLRSPCRQVSEEETWRQRCPAGHPIRGWSAPGRTVRDR